MLRACWRVLRPGGRLAFYTIFVPPGLSQADQRRALRSGPPAVASGRRAHADLLLSAGFTRPAETDLTADFLRTARAWYEGRERRATELRAAEGEASFAEGQADRRRQLRAIEAGLLRRSLFVARRP